MADEISFTGGFIYDRTTIYVTAIIDALEEQDVRHALMLRWSAGKWVHWPIEARVVAHCVCSGPKGRLVFALSEDGRIHIADGSQLHWESLARFKARPGLGNLISMRLIGNAVYIVGMQRQVYKRRLTDPDWTRADIGCVVPEKSLEIASFEALDGTSEEDIYGVGLYGEIWRYDGLIWRRLDSPTNVKLQAVCCVDEDTIYIAGARGLVLKGNENTWKFVNNTSTELTFWGIARYKDQIYLSTDQGSIFTICNDEIILVRTGLEPLSTFSLHVSDGLLLSTGRKDLAIFDGSNWQRLNYHT